MLPSKPGAGAYLPAVYILVQGVRVEELPRLHQNNAIDLGLGTGTLGGRDFTGYKGEAPPLHCTVGHKESPPRREKQS